MGIDRETFEWNGRTAELRLKMGWGVRNRVQSDGVKVVIDPAGKAQSTFDLGAYQTALLLHNVFSIDGQTVNSAMLDDLDPDFGDAILTRINDLNTQATDPKSLKAAGKRG